MSYYAIFNRITFNKALIIRQQFEALENLAQAHNHSMAVGVLN